MRTDYRQNQKVRWACVAATNELNLKRKKAQQYDRCGSKIIICVVAQARDWRLFPPSDCLTSMVKGSSFQ